MKKMLILNLKKRYPFQCKCGHELEAAPSLFQNAFQMNHGSITCPKCKKHTKISIDKNNEKMIEADGTLMLGLPDACFREATKEEEELYNKQQDERKKP